MQENTRRILKLLAKLAFLVTVLIVAIRWNPDVQRTEALILPSGKHVRTLERSRIEFNRGSSTLVLKYLTDIKPSQHDALSHEADEIWQAFRGEVEKAGCVEAILSANHKGLFSKKADIYQFVYTKQLDGTWKLVDEGKVALQGM